MIKQGWRHKNAAFYGVRLECSNTGIDKQLYSMSNL